MILDARLHAVRPDLADAALEGQVMAERFVMGAPYRVVQGQLALRRSPGGALDSQLLFGESVRVFEIKEGWAWVQNVYDGYVGYVQAQGLAAGAAAPTHQVAVPRTFRFSAADIKAPPLDQLSLISPLAIVGESDRFLELADGGFVYRPHAEPLGTLHPDWVATAALLLHTPYLWGGRSALGIDCSGLAQLSLRGAGRVARRDSYQQRDDGRIGPALPGDQPPQRGDLLFSPGHVALAVDDQTILHANALDLRVAFEGLAAFRARLAARGEAITAIRRPAP